jgi:hypothetical protein
MWTKQVFNVDLLGFHIRDNKDNKIFDDTLTLKVLSMNEGEEEVYLYVDVDPTTNPLMIKIIDALFR